MPFPLAHPAAVLPLRRLCPRWLSLPALMIGCLAPDSSYFFLQYGTNLFAHTLGGSVVYCLPAAGLMFLVYHLIREPLTDALPEPHREALLPISHMPSGSPIRIGLSLLVGIWSHLFLDWVTRESEFVVTQLPLQDEMTSIRETGIPPTRLLWYALTLLGLGWLVAAYLQFLKRSTGSMRVFASWDLQRYVLWALLLVFPGIALLPFTLHHAEGWPHLYAIRRFLYVWSAGYLVALGLSVVATGFVLRGIQSVHPKRELVLIGKRPHRKRHRRSTG